TSVVSGERTAGGVGPGRAVRRRLDLELARGGAATVTAGGRGVDLEGVDVHRLRQLDDDRLVLEHVGRDGGAGRVLVPGHAAPARGEAEIDRATRTTPEVGVVRPVEVDDLGTTGRGGPVTGHL